MAMLGDHHAAVLALQAVHDLREPVLHVREGHLLTNRHGYKYSYFCAGADRRAMPGHAGRLPGPPFASRASGVQIPSAPPVPAGQVAHKVEDAGIPGESGERWPRPAPNSSYAVRGAATSS